MGEGSEDRGPGSVCQSLGEEQLLNILLLSQLIEGDADGVDQSRETVDPLGDQVGF